VSSVVIADPDVERCASLEERLRSSGWEVTRSTAVADAFQQARQRKPSAVVVRGPLDGGGLALIQKLRSCAHTALLPVVAAFDAPRETLAQWGVQAPLDAGADDARVASALETVTASPPAPVAQAPDLELGRPARLEALRRTGLLDTKPEASFDRIARLTARLLDVPVVLLSLVDRQRQFFKAQVGVPEPIATAQQTPLSHSFCQWVVTAHEELVVSDARKHPVLRTNGATVEMGIVAYAGVPLRMDARETMGSFCAIDRKPRDWDARELRALRDAGDVIEGLTVLRQAARLPPLSLEEFRAMTGAVGAALQATMRLHEAGSALMSADERHSLIALASDLGRQLAVVSGGFHCD
jgi:CheY-like chemotaxis protein